MAHESNLGANALARVLTGRMQKENRTPPVLDFGNIEADYSLKTNTFPVPIPKSDYTVCRHIGGLTIETEGGRHSGHETGTGVHDHKIPIPVIEPGDRVLVAWVQSEAVVIDVILPADAVRHK